MGGAFFVLFKVLNFRVSRLSANFEQWWRDIIG